MDKETRKIDNLPDILQAVANFIRVDLKARIALFIERAVQWMRDRSYQSFSARQQGHSAERWLLDNRKAVESALHQRMQVSFAGQAGKTSGDVTSDGGSDELRLLDDESLNVIMLRAKLVSSVMAHARENVVALEVRLEVLKQGGAQINARAFSPGAIADGFIDVLEQLKVPTEVQIVLMEVYSDAGAEMLTDFYKDLNQLLINKGVMPGYKYTIVKGASPKSTQALPGGTIPPGGGIFGGLPGTMPGGMPPVPPMPPGQAPAGEGKGDGKANVNLAPAWPAVASGQGIPAHFAQLLDSKLNAMQIALAHLTNETWQPGTLKETFKLPPPISLSPEQEESIDHIEAVFLDLIRDTRISARFRSELNRLILPLMSLRLTDAELFKNPENPVRRFIRQLALLGFRDLESPIREFEHIGLIVGRIVSERAQEIESFSSGADALYTIARNEVRRQLEALHQSREPKKDRKDRISEETVTDSHRFVQSALRSMSAGLHLPTVIQHFVLRLLAPWMMVRYQRHGEESDQMRDCILFASTFFSLLEPSISEEEHKSRIQLRQQTLEQMAFRALRARMREEEVVILLEGVAEYFDSMNSDMNEGLQRSETAGEEFVSYLDDLPITRAR